VEREVVIGRDEIPLLLREMLFLRVLLYVFYAAPYLFEGVEEDFVGARGDDGVMGRHFVGEAKAQATSDGFCEVVPDRQGIVLVRADQEVNVIAADGARVTGAGWRANHVVDRLRDRFAFGVVDPDDGEIQ
jgi:hypothetical protein